MVVMTDDALHAALLEQAIALAVESATSGGGPFGAIIVRDNNVIARAANRVTRDHDPTAHAEVLAVRQACRTLETHVLAGCTLYTSCEPCPMCLGASLWSRLDAIFYAATRDEAARAGFDDARFYRQFHVAEETSLLRHLPLPGRNAPFEAWSSNPDRVPY